MLGVAIARGTSLEMRSGVATFRALHGLGERLASRPDEVWEWIDRLQSAHRFVRITAPARRGADTLPVAARRRTLLLEHATAAVPRSSMPARGGGLLMVAVARVARRTPPARRLPRHRDRCRGGALGASPRTPGARRRRRCARRVVGAACRPGRERRCGNLRCDRQSAVCRLAHALTPRHGAAARCERPPVAISRRCSSVACSIACGPVDGCASSFRTSCWPPAGAGAAAGAAVARNVHRSGLGSVAGGGRFRVMAVTRW